MTKIGQLASREILTVAPSDCIAEAARLMTARRVGSAIVMTDEAPGIITERDVLRAVADGVNLGTATVEGYMTANAITASDDWELKDAATRMAEGGFRHLIVLTSDGEVGGMLSIRDLLEALLRASEPALS